MRYASLLSLVAGCAFSHGQAQGGAAADGSGSGPSDGRGGDALADTATVAGPPVIDTTSTTAAGKVATLNWTHTASGNHRLVIVGVSWGLDTESVTSVSYGGTAMTELGTRVNPNKDIHMAMWELVAPPTGAQNIVVTFSKTVGDNAIGGAVSFTGVDQTTPTSPFVFSDGGGSAISLAVTSGPNELVMDTIGVDSNPSGLTIGSGQTQAWTQHPGRWGAASTKPGATSVTMSWTETGSTDDWVQGAVSIKGG